MRRITRLVSGVLVLAAVFLTPKAILADDDGLPAQGTFALTYMFPSAVDYCASGGTPIEVQGIGHVSRMGSLFLTVKKCLTFPVGFPAGTYTGTFKMTAGDGDTLKGKYAATQDFSMSDSNGFGPAQGTLTVTGGTGRFSNASGVLSFTAVVSPVSVGVTAPTANGMAYLLVRGNVLFPEEQ
jgi:hypothetical protein